MGEAGADQDDKEKIPPPAFAVSARDASIQALRQILVRREAIYGGLGLNTLFSSPSLAVIFEALPTASPSSPGYTPSAHMAFLTGLRLLMQLSRYMHVVYYAVLGVQQAATRSAFAVPAEAERMFEDAARALENNPWEENPKKAVLSNWVVDLTRSTADEDASRLGDLVAEMDSLGVGDDR